MIEHIELLVEEPSAEAALRVLLPRFLDDVSFEVYTHQGKKDLLGKLPSRLNAYAKWLPDNWRIVVLIDRDSDDCRALKQRIEAIAADAGLRTPSRRSHSGRFDARPPGRRPLHTRDEPDEEPLPPGLRLLPQGAEDGPRGVHGVPSEAVMR